MTSTMIRFLTSRIEHLENRVYQARERLSRLANPDDLEAADLLEGIAEDEHELAELRAQLLPRSVAEE